MAYTLKHGEKDYTLDQEHCDGIFNDDLMPIKNFSYEVVNQWLNHMPNDNFDIEYYEDDCAVCPPKPRGKKKLVPYLEGHFYVFTKSGEVVITSIDPTFVQGSFEEMSLRGTVDQSYILSIIICPICGAYEFSLEQVEM